MYRWTNPSSSLSFLESQSWTLVTAYASNFTRAPGLDLWSLIPQSWLQFRPVTLPRFWAWTFIKIEHFKTRACSGIEPQMASASLHLRPLDLLGVWSWTFWRIYEIVCFVSVGLKPQQYHLRPKPSELRLNPYLGFWVGVELYAPGFAYILEQRFQS